MARGSRYNSIYIFTGLTRRRCDAVLLVTFSTKLFCGKRWRVLVNSPTTRHSYPTPPLHQPACIKFTLSTSYASYAVHRSAVDFPVWLLGDVFIVDNNLKHYMRENWVSFPLRQQAPPLEWECPARWVLTKCYHYCPTIAKLFNIITLVERFLYIPLNPRVKEKYEINVQVFTC